MQIRKHGVLKDEPRLHLANFWRGEANGTLSRVCLIPGSNVLKYYRRAAHLRS